MQVLHAGIILFKSSIILSQALITMYKDPMCVYVALNLCRHSFYLPLQDQASLDDMIHIYFIHPINITYRKTDKQLPYLLYRILG